MVHTAQAADRSAPVKPCFMRVQAIEGWETAGRAATAFEAAGRPFKATSGPAKRR